MPTSPDTSSRELLWIDENVSDTLFIVLSLYC
jgi:hypothetical protein